MQFYLNLFERIKTHREIRDSRNKKFDFYSNLQPQAKGKQGTKGAKQIVEENSATLKFYRNMAAGGSTIYLLVTFLMFEFTGLTIVSATN